MDFTEEQWQAISDDIEAKGIKATSRFVMCVNVDEAGTADALETFMVTINYGGGIRTVSHDLEEGSIAVYRHLESGAYVFVLSPDLDSESRRQAAEEN